MRLILCGLGHFYIITRTAREFMAHSAGKGAGVLWGICYEGEETPPYGPWIAVLRRYTRDTDSAALARQMGPGAAAIAEIVPELREKLPNLPLASRLPPAEARLRLFDSLIAFLMAVSQVSGLVISLDSLQWADASSLQFLEHLTSEMQRAKILIWGTCRDEAVARDHPLTRVLGELIKHPGYHRIHLAGLSGPEVDFYMQKTMESPPSDELIERVCRTTAGNPLFLVELVREMQEHNGAGDWEPGIPEGVREAIGRRLSRLSAECVRVLSLASVIGRSFELKLLTHVETAMPEDKVLGNLERAMALGIIEEVEDTVDRYRFCHVLVQDTLLAELSAARKAHRHARIAEAMEFLYGPDPGVRAGELVRHLAEGVEQLGIEKLARYTLLAAEHALVSYAPDEALSLVDRALAIKEAQWRTADTADFGPHPFRW